MSGHYVYTPYIWPMLASAIFTAVLSVFAWQRRSVPGALPFAIGMLAGTLNAISAVMQLAAADVPARIFWVILQTPWPLLGSTAMLCFALEYASLGRWLTRRVLVLLAIPILIHLLLAFTNDIHHWMWPSFSVAENIQPVYGIGSLALISYGYLLVLLNVITLLWLFARSPLHRWPVTLMLLCRLATSIAFFLGIVNRNPFAPMDPTILTVAFTSGIWAFALFHYRMFDPAPIARKMVIEQMQEGMIVLDTAQKIVDLNRAAEKILGLPAARVRGREAVEILPAFSDLNTRLNDPQGTQPEIKIGPGRDPRYYAQHISPLKERGGSPLGSLILLHDVTEQKRAQAQIMEQQRAVAALNEREQLARELHDELAQELAFVNLQAQVAYDLVQAGQAEQACTQLARLAEVAREAQVDVRGQISKLSLTILPGEGIVTALRRFIDIFHRMYGIQSELIFLCDPSIISLGPATEIQLLRIIQEAFTNIRKHACAQNVCVSMQMKPDPGCTEVIIEDDGVGFDPSGLADTRESFGLRIMSERAAEIGGSVQVSSQSGHGTRVIVRIPVASNWN